MTTPAMLPVSEAATVSREVAAMGPAEAGREWGPPSKG